MKIVFVVLVFSLFLLAASRAEVNNEEKGDGKGGNHEERYKSNPKLKLQLMLTKDDNKEKEGREDKESPNDHESTVESSSTGNQTITEEKPNIIEVRIVILDGENSEKKASVKGTEKMEEKSLSRQKRTTYTWRGGDENTRTEVKETHTTDYFTGHSNKQEVRVSVYSKSQWHVQLTID